LRLAAGTALQVPFPGAQFFDDLAQSPGARRPILDQCFEICDFGRDGLKLSHVSAFTSAGHSVMVHSLSGRSRRTRFPVSGSLTQTDRFQTTRPMYRSFCNMALSAEMSQRPSWRRSVRFHCAPGDGIPRAFKSAATRTHDRPLSLRTQRDTHPMRQRAKNVDQLAPRHGDIARLFESHFGGGNELDLEIRARDRQPIRLSLKSLTRMSRMRSATSRCESSCTITVAYEVGVPRLSWTR
jgi:hypothetical protein